MLKKLPLRLPEAGQFDKKKVIAGTIFFVVLYALSCRYLFTGFNKRFLVYSFLCAAAAAFVIVPRPSNRWISICSIVLYFIFVPKRIFERIEVPVHSMDRIQPGVLLATIFIILLIYAVFLLFTQHLSLALGFGNIFLLIAFLINYYVVQFRGDVLTYNQLRAAKTALSVVNNYQFTVSMEQWYSILYFILFIAWGFWCEIPYADKKYYHIAVSGVSVAGMFLFYFFWNGSGYLEKYGLQGHYWNLQDNLDLNGFLLNFRITMKEGFMEKPAGYSQKMLTELAEQVEGSYQPSVAEEVTDPNIIIIMNEAWSDLRILGSLETTQDFMPFTDSLQNNTLRGNLDVKVLGGLTANTEFEALTGDSLAFLSPTAIPYQLQVNHTMPALPGVLGEQGYQTMAMHAGPAAAWNRNNVYEYFGFDTFVDANNFSVDCDYVGAMISDSCNFNEIIWRYEHRDTDKPFFLFDVTIQNHADYYYQTDITVNLISAGGTSAEEIGYIGDVETYLSLMLLTDQTFKELIGYFENVDEPTVICMFGDHQPNLSENFYQAIFADSGLTEEEQESRKFITPYIIWANYDIELPEAVEMSANYLGPTVLECAGVTLPTYYKFILEAKEERPVLTYRNVEENPADEWLRRYRILQYNQLIEEDYRKDLFSVQVDF